MAQSSSRIAEAFCGGEHGRKGDAKLRGDSVTSKSSLDPVTCADTGASAQPQQRGTDELAEVSRALADLREAVAPLAPDLPAQPPRMAPGSFNIASRPLRLVAFEPNLDTRRLVISEPWTAIERRKDASTPFGKSSLVMTICAGAAMSALAALYLVEHPRQFDAFMMKPSSRDASTGERSRLLVQAQKGLANEPLPLGVMVEHAPDGATVTIEGLPDGAELSLGSRTGRSGWSVAAADLERTYIGAPVDFAGVIGPIATLRSVSGTVLDRRALRFEWSARDGEPSERPSVETSSADTASAEAAAATPSASSSPPQSTVALLPAASPPDTVGRASGSEAVPPKRGARLKSPRPQSSAMPPDSKRSSASNHADPILSIFGIFSWDELMGMRSPRIQTPSGKPQARRTEERRATRRAQ
jgi:hypothetical protein